MYEANTETGDRTHYLINPPPVLDRHIRTVGRARRLRKLMTRKAAPGGSNSGHLKRRSPHGELLPDVRETVARSVWDGESPVIVANNSNTDRQRRGVGSSRGSVVAHGSAQRTGVLRLPS